MRCCHGLHVPQLPFPPVHGRNPQVQINCELTDRPAAVDQQSNRFALKLWRKFSSLLDRNKVLMLQSCYRKPLHFFRVSPRRYSRIACLSRCKTIAGSAAAAIDFLRTIHFSKKHFRARAAPELSFVSFGDDCFCIQINFCTSTARFDPSIKLRNMPHGDLFKSKNALDPSAHDKETSSWLV